MTGSEPGNKYGELLLKLLFIEKYFLFTQKILDLLVNSMMTFGELYNKCKFHFF